MWISNTFKIKFNFFFPNKVYNEAIDIKLGFDKDIEMIKKNVRNVWLYHKNNKRIHWQKLCKTAVQCTSTITSRILHTMVYRNIEKNGNRS